MKIVNNLIEKINNYKNLRIIKTTDGSSSIYNIEMDEIYHSRNGAIQESLHVFILLDMQKRSTTPYYITPCSESLHC